ncbi:hypothetical protein [Clostridium botulinum]|nr:hypothetical protein [Clostridium botulinum]
MINYEFVVDVEPDEETINEFHKNLALILINKYGVQTMKEVLNILEKEQ